MNSIYMSNQSLAPSIESSVQSLRAELERSRAEEKKCILQLSTLHSIRSKISSSIEELSVNYKKEIKALQQKVKKLQNENKQLQKKNALYEMQIQNFEKRIIEKDKMISSILAKEFIVSPLNKITINNSIPHGRQDIVHAGNNTSQPTLSKQSLTGSGEQRKVQQISQPKIQKIAHKSIERINDSFAQKPNAQKPVDSFSNKLEKENTQNRASFGKQQFSIKNNEEQQNEQLTNVQKILNQNFNENQNLQNQEQETNQNLNQVQQSNMGKKEPIEGKKINQILQNQTPTVKNPFELNQNLDLQQNQTKNPHFRSLEPQIQQTNNNNHQSQQIYHQQFNENHESPSGFIHDVFTPQKSDLQQINEYSKHNTEKQLNLSSDKNQNFNDQRQNESKSQLNTETLQKIGQNVIQNSKQSQHIQIKKSVPPPPPGKKSFRIPPKAPVKRNAKHKHIPKYANVPSYQQQELNGSNQQKFEFNPSEEQFNNQQENKFLGDFVENKKEKQNSNQVQRIQWQSDLGYAKNDFPQSQNLQNNFSNQHEQIDNQQQLHSVKAVRQVQNTSHSSTAKSKRGKRQPNRPVQRQVIEFQQQNLISGNTGLMPQEIQQSLKQDSGYFFQKLANENTVQPQIKNKNQIQSKFQSNFIAQDDHQMHGLVDQSSIEQVQDTSMISNPIFLQQGDFIGQKTSPFKGVRKGSMNEKKQSIQVVIPPPNKKMSKKKAKRQNIQMIDPSSFA